MLKQAVRGLQRKGRVLPFGRLMKVSMILLGCTILLLTFCTPGILANEVYKSAHISCWENAGYYYGTLAIGVRVNYGATSQGRAINWVKVSVTPYYEIYPTTDKAKTYVVVKGLQFKKFDGSYYKDNTEWTAAGAKAEYTYYIPWGDFYGIPEVWVFFEVNEGIPESQHRYKWSVQYGFEQGYFYVNNNEPGYATYKPGPCPYCKQGKAHPG